MLFILTKKASVYEGEDVYLIMRREYFTDWSCDFDLLYYPFDTQVQTLIRGGGHYKLSVRRNKDLLLIQSNKNVKSDCSVN